VRRFFRTPKGLLLLVLGALVLLAAPAEGWRLVWPGVAAAAVAAMALDAPILRWREGAWVFPSGALLTGLIVAMILTPHEPWIVAAATAAFAVVSKYLVRTRSANVFNPAALALVAAFYIFGTGQDWWGALPDLPPIALAALVGGGAFIAQRVNKIPIVLAFLGTYYTLFTIAAFLGDPARVGEVFRPPDLNAVLYFVCFMLTDPPTAPTRQDDQIKCGVLVAITSFAAFEWLGAVCYLLIGLLIGNVWEAWRRRRIAARRRSESRLRALAQP